MTTPLWIAGAVGVVVALAIGYWLWRSGVLLWWDIQDGKDETNSDDASDKENWHE